jgi:hypothetical protein
MDAKARSRVTATTQDHLQIQDIMDDLVITKSGAVALVVQTNAVNFDLLSEYEQDNKIMAFAGLLNSLNFQIQIMIKTERIDISTYLTYLKGQQNKAMTPGLQRQLNIYTNFIENIIETNDVLDKKFYIVVPYNPAIGLSGVKIKQDKQAMEQAINQNIEKTLEQSRISLYPKRDHILKQLARMGLVGHQLTNDELITLFYDIYNPHK